MPQQYKQRDILTLINQLLCHLGLHDYQIIEATFGFGERGGVERDQCRCCGKVRTRQI